MNYNYQTHALGYPYKSCDWQI